jgi:hypothetical protein
MDRDPDQAFNQSGELSDYALFSTHSAAVAACERAGARCYTAPSP